MSDSIATFALQAETQERLSTALGQCFADYFTWHQQAVFIANFANDARLGGVKSVLTDRNREALDFAEGTGIITTTAAKTSSNLNLALDIAEHQIASADQGVKISAIVMLHGACEKFLWRLVRFGLVANREEAIKRVANRTVTLEMLRKQDKDALIDDQIEKWWNQLERDTVLNKWNSLVKLVDYPMKLNDPPSWHFDSKMLSRFDEVRHNAVHQDREAIKAFNFENFASQLYRAQFVWLTHVGLQMKLKVHPEELFVLKKSAS